MKIRKIRFKNINSLRGEHEVDFLKAPLSNSRLFAITGPTGSGKSTLLDIITLALYNRVPRLPGKVSKNLIAQSGALLTRHCTEAYAAVEYECKEGIFRSSWEISVNRNGNLREYGMELVDISSMQPLDLKKGEVPGRNEELIGLNYEQFSKSILLAQGEFAEFLKVNKSERGLLLEKITGTSIYRELGKQAYDKKQYYARELEHLRERRKVLSEHLLEDEQLTAFRQEQAQLQKSLTVLEQQLKDTAEQQKIRTEIKRAEDKVVRLQQSQQVHMEATTKFEKAHREKLKSHEATASLARQLERWRQDQANLLKLGSEKTALKATLSQQEKELRECHQQIQQFIGHDSLPGQPMEELENFRQKVVGLEQNIHSLLSSYRLHQDRLNMAGTDWGYRADFKEKGTARAQEMAREIENLEQEKITAAAELDRLKQEWPNWQGKQIEELRDSLQQKELRLQEARRLQREVLQQLKTAKADEEKISLLTKEISELPRLIEKLSLQQKAAKSEQKFLLTERENQKLRASLSELRAQLDDGEACPLCGSEEHPWASQNPPQNNALGEQLSELEKTLQSLEQELLEKKSQLQQAQRQLSELSTSLKESNERIAQDEEQLKKTEADWDREKPVDWDERLQHLQDEKKALQQWEKQQLRARGIERILPILSEMQAETLRGLELRSERDKHYQGKQIDQDCSRLKENWLGLKQEITHRSESLQKISQLELAQQETLQAMRSELTPLLHEQGFANIDEALAARMAEDEYLRLSKEAGELRSNLERCRSELSQWSDQLKALKEQRSEEADDELIKSATALQEAREAQQERAGEVNRQLTNHREYSQKVTELDLQITKEEKTGYRWEVLCKLIGDATGKTFNNFAQDLTLQQLLILANRRLQHLSDRYRIASPKEGEEDSLVAIDEHLGGQRRSVKTLSGGETFVLSLSLALALSDLASKQVEINSLFIDEGFGTLDPETLDQTLDVLERLQAESAKTIGVISHVEALKERIDTQIRLERNGQGYSRLKIESGVS